MRVRLAVILILSASLLAGCGGSSQKTNGVEDEAATEIVNTSLDTAKTAKSVHVAGSIGGGTPVTLDLHLVRDKGGKGTIGTDGMTFEVVSVDGKVYIKADAESLKRLGSSLAAQLLAGRWFVAPASLRQLSDFSNLTDLTKLFTAALGSYGKLEKGDTTDVNGQPAIEVTDTSRGGTLYVATTGKPYPLQITGGSDRKGSIAFDQWDEAVSLKAPENPLDLSKLVGG